MKLLLCWVTVHAGLCFRPLYPIIHQRVVSFHVANQTFMADSGLVFSSVSKVKCTLICFERTSCTSVFYWRSEGKCRTITIPNAPAEQVGPVNVTRQDAKIHRQNTKSNVTKHDPNRKVYYGVLRNITCHHCENKALKLGQEDSEKMPIEPADVNKQAKTRYKSEQYIYFKEIGLSLIHHLDNKSWHEADTLCERESGSIFVIDNQTKQDAAKRLVEFSGQELTFIGVYNYFFIWKYLGSGKVRYANWAPREPHFPTFAAMSRSSGYKWVTTGQHDRASWICAKRDN